MRRRAFVVPLVLIGLPILLYWPHFSGWLSINPLYTVPDLSAAAPRQLLPGSPWIDASSGVVTQALEGFTARAWLHGDVPWWDPYIGVGMPHAGALQPAVFFLPFVLLAGLFDGVLYLRIALQITAGFATYALLRQLGIARRIALPCAVLFELSGCFAWFSDPSIAPVPFLPLFLYGIERALAAARAGMRGGWVWIALACGYSLLAGFPETAYLDGLLALAWAITRLCGAARGCRIAFAVKVMAGGSIGLMLAAPALVPFVDTLARAYIGNRAHMGTIGFDRAQFAMLLLPYVYGPIFFAGRYDIWSALMGGYVGAALVLLALAGTFHTGRERGLRWLLAAWIGIGVADAAAAPLVRTLSNLITFMNAVELFRYAEASWSLAAIILAAYTLDHWCRAPASRPKPVWLAAAITIGLAAAAVYAALPTIRALGETPGYGIYFVAALVWAALLIAICTWLLAGRATGRRTTLLLSAILLDAALQFTVPLLSGTRNRAVDRPTVAFLQSHLGLQRFYTIGPLIPNYGVYFDIAAINHNTTPQPQAWIDHIQTQLDPYTDPTTFNGSFPPPMPGIPSRPEMLRQRLAAYAALGVKYVLAPRGENPFDGSMRDDLLGEPKVPRVLVAGESLSGDVPDDWLQHRTTITEAAVIVGTFAGQSTGALTLDLCNAGACAHGQADLATAIDNLPLPITLDHELALVAGQPTSFHLTHSSGKGPVAIWLFHRLTGGPGSLVGPAGALPGLAPKFGFTGHGPTPQPRRVFRTAIADIYDIETAAPYFEPSTPCTLRPADRTHLQLDCARPGTLIRRELFDPGWHATINHQAEPVTPAGDLFQKVSFDAGTSTIAFDYTPPFIGWAYAACALATGCVLWQSGRRWVPPLRR